MTGVKYVEITDKGLTIVTKEGERQTIEADTILPAVPFSPNTELFKAMEGKVPEIYAIGDCSEPRLIIDAIADGYRIGVCIVGLDLYGFFNGFILHELFSIVGVLA